MRRTPRLAVAIWTWIAFAWPSGAAAQVVGGTTIPNGLTASDWSSIRSAYAAGRHEVSAARNTLAIGALAEKAYLKASNTGQGDGFGLSVAVFGDTVVVGAPTEDSSAAGVGGNQANDGATDAGAAYVFVRNGTLWSQQAYLKASNPDPDDRFGGSVAISGGTVVVGARNEASNATGVNGNQGDDSIGGAGAAYVFVRNGTSWSQQAYLKASNSDADDWFGGSVAISGHTVVVGAVFEDSLHHAATNAGAAYVFVRSGTSWSQQAYLKASNAEEDDVFGGSVAVSGDTVVVGATSEDSNATGVDGDQGDDSASGAGAAYVFVRSGTSWSQQAYLKASNTNAIDDFGDSVAISGDTVVVAATSEDSNATGVDGDQDDDSASASGAAYVFVRNGTSWSQQAYLKASNTDASDEFGDSVAISGDTVVVAATSEDSNATGVDGDQDDDSASASGAAYVFVRGGTSWSQQAYLKASNTDASDEFGIAVGVSGETIVVGASLEDSNTTGVNGDQLDDNASGAGAVYVFDGVPGVTWWVDNTAACPGSGTVSAPFCALADAIGVSSLRGDTIIVRAGTGIYTGPCNTGLAFGGRALTLRSEHGPGSVTLDGQGAFGPSLVSFVGGEGPDTVLEGFTLRGGGNDVGGGIHCTNSSPTIRNCIVVGNYASSLGGGIAVDGGAPTILDCLVADNSSGVPPFFPGRGAGMALIDSGATVRGVTIAHNVATDGFDLPGEGGGLYVSNSPDASLVSTIVWGNVASDGAGIQVASGAAPAASHCDVQGGFGGTAMLTADPLFVVAGPLGDYHLQARSPCVGAGDTAAVAPDETDIDGEARVQGGAVEIGADELSEDPWVDLGDGTSGILGTPVLVMSGPLLPASLLTLDLSAASPSSLAVLFLSLSSTPAPFLGGLLHAHPIDELVVLATDGSGSLGGSVVFPALPGGTELWFQIGSADPSVPVFGASLSNGVRGTVP